MMSLVVAWVIGQSAGTQTLGPIDYFEQKCARCHGTMGSFYGPDFAKDLSDQELVQKIRDMAQGPAKAPLPERALAMQTAFHRSMVDGSPFLCVLRGGRTGYFGEVTPGSVVTLVQGKVTVLAKIDGFKWSSKVSPLDVTKPILIRARLKDRETQITWPKSTLSHTKAVKPHSAGH